MPNPVRITYFTDPLCPWCWAFEPQWRRLRFEFGAGLRWRYRMGGLLAHWGRYHDSVNEVHNPGQMATQWLQVGELTAAPIDASIWRAGPPASSYPACLAFKAAESFGPPFAEAYLRRLREAVMLEKRDISRREELVDLAAAGAAPAAFETALDAPEATGAFRDDLTEARYREVQRFPTLVLHRAGPRGLALVGYQPIPFHAQVPFPISYADRSCVKVGRDTDVAGCCAGPIHCPQPDGRRGSRSVRVCPGPQPPRRTL
ncbi:DsbA family protein [Gemmata sp. JC673]|uniref:DsbA family protein n=1 Tax=Gemmata algarum TaxID=2975278 RepID=A0ABU5EZ22_9BACT|nr:DsbA family protein [Gemmata algarum]MDY3560560.1 DsbA family protein [Gemmata algarum]